MEYYIVRDLAVIDSAHSIGEAERLLSEYRAIFHDPTITLEEEI